MANDIRRLKPSECCRMLNSTSLGEVINERQLYRYRTRAGNRIGDGQHVDLLRFSQWLLEERNKPKPPASEDPYADAKERARSRNAAIAQAGRDIGDLPVVEDAERKTKAASSFQFFCEAYFKLTFHLSWSPDHIKVIRKIEEAVVRGGLFSLAMARGSGKSSLAEVACIWAVLNGYRDFVCLIGSDEGHACDMLDSIKTELDANDLLLADYPEVCFPIQALDGIANRANGQLYQGKRTQIGWTAKEVVLPTIAGSKASGAIIKVAGLTGRIRGMKFKRPDGKTVRPSLVVLDDPQTDESARSLSQCANREAILAGAVLGLAGPGKKISGIMPCTVIRPGDMADNILDRDKHPEWNGERTRMVNSFPTNKTLWERYAEIRSEGLRAGDGGAAGTEFYRQNREAMDAGAEVSWKERCNHDELSAIQHAMNLKLQDEAAFYAEYQNEPLPAETVDADQLTPEQVAGKINNMPRLTVPIAGNHLTAFIDVQGKLLFYVVAAWEDDFTGYVVDYGTYPDQQRPHFTLRDARHTLANATDGTGLEGSIYAGLDSLTTDLLGREWQRDDGAAMKIGRCLIDANWGHSTNVVYQFCRQSPHASILLPSHGRFVGASSNPFSEYKRRPGDRVGLNWRIPSINGKRAIRHIIYDTNWWKSFTHARLAVAMGDHGCLSIFGDRPEQHRMFAEQIIAEYFVKTEGRGRTVDEWKARPEQPDNHWLDCLVGCAVGASMQGALLFGTDVAALAKRDRVSFRDLQRKKRS
ncbi:Phage terminase large subunit (GpA) [Rubripirellula amarantea]|uniref:Phage terminase large subunit (GpA) n=1 Tax=Rubripirellula amarantea TaxID=2527999 RepID=A0A5C5WJU2_9BACT|nr:terminase gpA endonuclease subunit [Rubripirellula amarantea]TWT51046.1 Phage terminase large subunit (GpA) [Rubripirellula amarantea]